MKNVPHEKIDSLDVTASKCRIKRKYKEKWIKTHAYDMSNRRIFFSRFFFCADRLFLFIQLLDSRRQKTWRTNKKIESELERNASFLSHLSDKQKEPSGEEKRKKKEEWHVRYLY